MSADLAEFLKNEAAKFKAEAGKREGIVKEWSEAIHRLFSTIRTWLRGSDPGNHLVIEEGRWKVQEEGIGSYEVPRLDIEVFGRRVMIIPKARYTVATAHPPLKTGAARAAGRVDITDEINRHVLYRFQSEQGDIWSIDDLKGSPQQPLTQELFEAVLMSYLQ